MQRSIHRLTLLPAALVSCLFLFVLAFTVHPDASSYRLNPGDQMEISVWGDENLNRQVFVLPDGSITFPLAGRLDVEGLTSPEVEQRVAELLQKYVPDPVVTVTVIGTGGNRIFLVGKVTTPGVYVMFGPMNVMQALSLGGGLARFADESDILIIRRKGGTERSFKFDYDDVASGKNLETNILLEAGDVIVVP